MALKIEFSVQMVDEKCIDEISKSIADLDGVHDLTISLDTDRVTLRTSLPHSIIQEKIEKTGRKAVLKGYGEGLSAVALIGGNSGYNFGNQIFGIIRLAETPEGCIIEGTIDNLPPGEHGLHIHEYGDISRGCYSLGGHYNPRDSPHGGPEDDLSKRHVGDLGNIQVESTRRSTFWKLDKYLDLAEIIGRSIVITKDPDDLGRGNNPESKIDGNSGEGLTAGLIAKASGLNQNTKKICACNGVTLWDERQLKLTNINEHISNLNRNVYF
ncbi:hypothetical protein PUN28_000935 [Cardiocondyla obscurior]|uniref:superoxide dismutase n=1 Tax=Cardiocondyla obscurior TaxID=286306 RepID=A0AAW2H1X0_9HYME